MFAYWTKRSSNFGSPFINLNAGYDHTDLENDKQLKKLYDYIVSKPEFQENSEPYFICLNKLRIKKIVYPLIGVAVSKALCDALITRKGYYLRFFTAAYFAFYAYQYVGLEESTVKTDFLLQNFNLFPREVQKAFDNNDFRYAHKILAEIEDKSA